MKINTLTKFFWCFLLFAFVPIFSALGSSDKIIFNGGKDGTQIYTAMISKDGRHYFYDTVKAGEYINVIDGVKLTYPLDDALHLFYKRTNDDYSSLSYIAKSSNGYLMVINGKEVAGRYDSINSNVAITADKKHIAYGVHKDGKTFLVVDGKERPQKYEDVGNIVFSPDGEVIAYVASEFSYDDGKTREFVVFDDKIVSEKYERILWLAFSPDGKHFAYAVKDGTDFFVIFDGAKQKTYDTADVFMHSFSPDSQHLAYFAKKGDKYAVILDGKELAEESDPCFMFLQFSADSSELAYITGSDFKVAKNGNAPVSAGLVTCGNTKVSPDLKHFAVQSGELFINGRGVNADGYVSSFNFSPDYKRYAYIADNSVYVDDKLVLYKTYKEGSGGRYTEVIFSPDSQHYAYIAQDEKSEKFFMVIDGKRLEDFDWVSDKAFTADSKKLTYIAIKNGDGYWVEYDLSSPKISAPTSLPSSNKGQTGGLATALKGRILLQVESNGEAWYVNPDNKQRYYLGRPDDAFKIMRELGLGISNENFDFFNGYAPKRLSGKILIKVEDSGKAYYVNPVDLKMYYLGRPADAFQVMRELGLGIKNNDLDKINNASDNQGVSESAPSKTWIKEFGPYDANDYLVNVDNKGIIFAIDFPGVSASSSEKPNKPLVNIRGKEYHFFGPSLKIKGGHIAWFNYGDGSSMLYNLFLDNKVVARPSLGLMTRNDDGTDNPDLSAEPNLFDINKDGKLAYFDVKKETNSGKRNLIINFDGKDHIIGEYQDGGQTSETSLYKPLKVSVLQDGKVIYSYRDVTKLEVFVIVGGKKYGPYDKYNEFKVSLDGKNYGWAYQTKNSEEIFVMANEGKNGPYLGINQYDFSNSAKAWLITDENELYFVVNNEKYGPIQKSAFEQSRFISSDKNWGITYVENDAKTHFIFNGADIASFKEMCESCSGMGCEGTFFCEEVEVGSGYYAYTSRTELNGPATIFINGKNFGELLYPADVLRPVAYWSDNDYGFVRLKDNNRDIIVNGEVVYILPTISDPNNLKNTELAVSGNNWAYYEEIITNKESPCPADADFCTPGEMRIIEDKSVPPQRNFYINGKKITEFFSDTSINELKISDQYWAVVYKKDGADDLFIKIGSMNYWQ